MKKWTLPVALAVLLGTTGAANAYQFNADTIYNYNEEDYLRRKITRAEVSSEFRLCDIVAGAQFTQGVEEPKIDVFVNFNDLSLYAITERENEGARSYNFGTLLSPTEQITFELDGVFNGDGKMINNGAYAFVRQFPAGKVSFSGDVGFYREVETDFDWKRDAVAWLAVGDERSGLYFGRDAEKRHGLGFVNWGPVAASAFGNWNDGCYWVKAQAGIEPSGHFSREVYDSIAAENVVGVPRPAYKTHFKADKQLVAVFSGNDFLDTRSVDVRAGINVNKYWSIAMGLKNLEEGRTSRTEPVGTLGLNIPWTESTTLAGEVKYDGTTKTLTTQAGIEYSF